MNATSERLEKLAEQLCAAFELGTRNDGSKFYSLKHGSPDWMQPAIRKAHDGLFPNDWVYERCSDIAERLSDTGPGDWDDSISEWADTLVDVYNNARAQWLASNLYYGSLVDEAVKELGHSQDGIFGDIGIGQYRMIEQIAAALIQVVRDEAEPEEDDE